MNWNRCYMLYEQCMLHTIAMLYLIKISSYELQYNIIIPFLLNHVIHAHVKHADSC